MLKYPCLVLDHDDTVVRSEATINYPYFCYVLDKLRPGATITLDAYTDNCCHMGFTNMCREKYHFTEQEMEEEYHGWQNYILDHIPLPYPGIRELILRQKQEGGLVCVVSHSCRQNITRDYQVHFGMTPDAIYGWDLPENLRKPSSYPLEQIMKNYGLTPGQLLVVDDMKPAWEMAQKVSVPTAFAGWSRENAPDIAQEMTALCDYAFFSVEEFTKFLFD